MAQDCAAAVTQADLSRCAYEEFLSANAEYAAAYKTLSAGLPQKRRDNFRRMQKSWISYRTAACDFEAAASAGGSVQEMVRWMCVARMTRVRTRELVALGQCKEGDVTCTRPISQ
jgi:uncharacterized protein YecT (DUF1311 family)